jgi:hypothetical protein
MNPNRLRLSRRKFLGSVGATAAMLPFLRSLPGYAQGQAQTKLVLVFSGNGRIRHLWGADGSSGSLQFRPNLAPLQPHAANIVITEGVRNFCAPKIGGTHEGGMASLFTGSAEGSSSGGPVGHPSIDTLFMANNGGGTVRSDSLYQQIVADLNSAQNATPQNRCIFDASGVPRDPLRSGWEVMEQYIAGSVQQMGGSSEQTPADRANAALFASLNGQMSALKPKLCSEDQQRLEGMQEALEKAGQTVDKVSCELPTLPPKPNVEPWEAIWKPPSDVIDLSASQHWYRDRSRLSVDLLVAALACGVTRSGVLQYDQAASVAKAVGQSLDHHNTSHQQPQLYDFVEMLPGMAPDYKPTCLEHEENPKADLRTRMQSTWDQLSLWEKYYAEEFAYLVAQLDSHGVLDDTLVVWCSEIDAGNGHSHFNMPFLMAAGPNIPVQRGKVVRFPISYDNNNQMGCIPIEGTPVSHNQFLKTALHAVGVDVERVGSASVPAAGTAPATTFDTALLSPLLT